MKNSNSFLALALLLLSISACGSKESSSLEKAPQTTTENSEATFATEPEEAVSDKDISNINSPTQQKPETPKPNLKLPDIGYDKSKLPLVQKLDEIIMDRAWLNASYKLLVKEYQLLEEKTDVSFSGTPEDEMKAIISIIQASKHFRSYAIPIAQEATKRFTQKYQDDYAFEDIYRTAYYSAQDQINGTSDAGVVSDNDKPIIADGSLRRQVSSQFNNSYTPSLSSDLSSIEDILEDSEELIQDEVIGAVISQANTDLLVVDYKQGKELADVINNTLNKLKAVQVLDADNEEIKTAMTRVSEKKEARLTEIKTALENYNFPKRYDGGNVPSNASELENTMKSFLSQFKYSENKNYEILEIRVAGPWIDILHVLSGRHMYSQVDFYVAVPSLEDSNVVEVLLVTGKTSGSNHDSFGTYSVGGIGQMLKSKL